MQALDRRRSDFIRLFCTGSALLAFASPAFAQQVDSTPPLEEEESTIVVTGSVTRFSVPLAETPQAVTVMPAEQFERQGATTIEEALRFVPSVQAELAGRQVFDELLIRGFSQSRYRFRDGLRLDPGYLQQQEPWGLAAIEVLKGPASVLYGQIAPGGLVNMVSKVAGPQTVREAGITVGSFGLVRGFADIGGALDSEGRWSARLPILYSTRDDV